MKAKGDITVRKHLKGRIRYIYGEEKNTERGGAMKKKKMATRNFFLFLFTDIYKRK